MSHETNGASALSVYDFKSIQVRVVEKDGVAWFVAGDVAKALGYPDAKQMTRILDDDEAALHIVQSRSENGVVQDREVVIINESGLYHSLIKSRKPEAKPFRKWVTAEVLPTIRKTGRYEHPTVDPDQLPIAPHQQHELQVIVARKSGTVGAIRAMLWSRFNNHFKLGSYKQLPAGKFSEAVAYLEGIQTAHDPARVPGRDKVYNYPRSLLEQREFKAMDGQMPALLSIDMLAHVAYESPTVAMLREMNQDGHQVDAPLAEQVALREGLQAADQALRNIMSLAWNVLGQASSRAGQF